MAILESQISSYDEMQAQLAALRAENEALRKARQGKLSLKVSDKGAVSVYGMGKWPITLYRSQMERLLDSHEQIKAFIVANSAALTVKA